ncbi:predicted protein [Sparassis crispa]|uniref:Fungal-type protein kinase domain-containing protein n=1 Tax=Sparassis crispa TaxID=139825 RepID=A0A401GP70_9APHY|nr:predicted protein [Sparassis crispa]GBE83554.1 predicted protein [Sparassis crispa]
MPLTTANPAETPNHHSINLNSSCVEATNADSSLDEPEDLRLSHFENEWYAKTSEDYILGPMPTAQFLDFLPMKNMARMPTACGAFNHLDEWDMASGLRHSINSHNRCPGFVFQYNDPEDEEDQPALIMRMNSDDDDVPREYCELFIDIQKDEHGDFLCDPPPSVDGARHDFLRILGHVHKSKRQKARQEFGRNVCWATDALVNQHRLHYFSVAIHGTSARLLRWDPSGLVASAAFDLHEKPEILCEFLWRFAHASTVERGYDPTVEPASKNEEYRFKTVLSHYLCVQLGLSLRNDSLDSLSDSDRIILQNSIDKHYDPGHVAAVSIVEKADKAGVRQLKRCLVCRPVSTYASMRRGCMRGFWGVVDRAIVFLKDTWREWSLTDQCEGDVLEELHKAGVRHIPQFSGMATFQRTTRSRSNALMNTPAFQRTQTDRYRMAEWLCRSDRQILVRSRVHYRLILTTVGLPLQDIRGTEELLHATYDVYESIIDARVKAKVFHRDISIGNVLLFKEPGEDIRHGYLIDWELSSHIRDDGLSESDWTVGTQAFMSHRLDTGNGRLRHTIEDDMESLLYVVLYCGLHWLPHELDADKAVQAIFFNREVVSRNESGRTELRSMEPGEGKLQNKKNRKYVDPSRFAEPFGVWLETSMNYNHPREEEDSSASNAVSARENGDCSDAAVSPNPCEGNWDGPTPWKLYWEQYKANEYLPKNDKKPHFNKYDESEAKPKDVTRVVVHRAGIPPNKRKARHQREPADGDLMHRDGEPANGRPAKRARISAR